MTAPYDDLSAAAIAAASVAEILNDNAIATAEQLQFQDYMNEESIRGNNEKIYRECEQVRTNRVDIASGLLAIATFLIYDQYYDKYKEVIDWRDEITTRIKDCLEADIDHYIDVVMANMNAAISTLLASPTVSVNYADIVARYNSYSNSSGTAALNLVRELERKNCLSNSLPCDPTEGDIEGWATMGSVSAADGRARFDEARVPRRLDLISAAVNSAHGSTFNLPAFDYQALGNATNIAGSLASAYAGITNSAAGSFGYFSTNFVNSLGN